MNLVLIFLIIIFSSSLFFYGRSKTKSLAISGNIKLNALPKFYGYYLVLWCSIPALVFLLIWSLFEPVIIKSIIIDTAAKQLPHPSIQEHLDKQQEFYKRFYAWDKKAMEWTNFLKGALNAKTRSS